MRNGQTTDSFRIHSLKNRIIIVVALMLIVLTTVLTYSSFISYKTDARNRSASMLQDTTEQVAENIKRYFEEISRLSMQIYYNSTIMRTLNSEPTDNEIINLENRRIINDELMRLLFRGRNDVISCYIIGHDVYRAASKIDYLEIDRNWEQADWYHQALAGKSFSMLVSDTDENHMICSIVRTISSNTDYSKIVAVLKINYSASGITDICKLVQSGYAGQLCVLNDKNAVVYGSIPHGLNIDMNIIPNGISYYSYGQEYLINQAEIDNYGWRVLYIHSLNTLEAGAYQTLRRMLAISFLILAIISLVIYLLLKATLSPLAQMVYQLKVIRQGNENERMKIHREDEIGYLALSINEMLDRIKNTQEDNTTLMKQIYESELLQQKIKMQLLTKQIRPHFIMNTLNMIAIEAEMGDIDRCTENIRRLSIILQAITYSDSYGTIEKELNLVRSYLQLYQERHYDTFSFSIQIPDSILPLPFPMLLLQPIVENALIHGCEKTSKPTHISISARLETDDLFIIVEDNAGGIPKDKLNEIIQQLQTDSTGRENKIGLVNIQQRIKLIYGNEYGLHLDSKNELTRVTIHIPSKLMERKITGNVQSDHS